MRPLLLVFSLMLVALAACTASRTELVFPEGMLPHVRKEYRERCEKGKVLYDLNCAGCHNEKRGRRTVIPDFAPAKLQGYAIRMSNARHETSMPDTLVSEQELVLISNFLTYRKKVDSNPLKR